MPDRCYHGPAYRSIHPNWANDPLSGEGAKRYGGRFNPVGTAALYLSLKIDTAWFESQQGFPYKNEQPKTIWHYTVKASDIIDLTCSDELDRIAGPLRDLGCAWEWLLANKQSVPTHELAQTLIEDGINGIMVPSYATGVRSDAKNLVLWNWNTTDCIVTAHDDERIFG